MFTIGVFLSVGAYITFHAIIPHEYGISGQVVCVKFGSKDLGLLRM